MKRTGIILAAGIGSRLKRSDTDASLKPLIPLEGRPLVIRTLESLEKAGCGRAVIVLGWEADILRGRIRELYEGPLGLSFAYNERYDLQNGVSLLSARPFVTEEFVLVMADHLFDDAIMARISDRTPPPEGCLLCVDYKLSDIFDMDDATKVLEKDGSILKIGKHLETYNCIDTGAFLGTEGLMESIEQVYAEQGDASLSEGVQRLAESGRMRVLDIKDAYWQDVDTPEMLGQAEKLLRRVR